MSKIAFTDDAGNTQDVALPSGITLTVATPIVAPPPPVTSPPSPPPTMTGVTLSAVLADGTTVDLELQAGQRVPLIAGKIIGSVMYYADGAVCIENCYAGTTTDLAGTFTLTNGVNIIFTGPLTVWCYSRTRPFWIVQPQVNPSADLTLFPTLGGAPTATMAKDYAAADNGPMGMGCDTKSIGNGGEWPHLGPVPQWDSCWLTNPSADNATVVRGMADAGCPWPYHVIDPATNAMLDVTQFKQVSMLQVFLGAKNNPIQKYVTACPLSLSQAQGHDTNRNALACAIFGTDYDREELALWNNYVNSLWQNPGYRLPAGCCDTHNGELPRSIGRGLTSMLYAAKYSSNPAYFDAWVRPYLADLTARALAQTGIHVDQLALIYPNNGFAPWQNHIMIYGLGLALQFGYTEAQQAFDYFTVTLLDSILSAQHEFATLYSVPARDASGNLAPDWVAALHDAALFDNRVAAAITCAENSQELRNAMAEPGSMAPGDFCYDGKDTSPTNYCAIMRPAVVMAARYATDQPRAQAALAILEAHDRADYSQNPKYNLRSA